MSSTPVYQPPTTTGQPLYRDYYAFMSYADFNAWVAANDGSQPNISAVAE